MRPELSRRELWGWLGVVCLIMFGIGYVVAQRLRQAGPMEFHPDRTAPVASSLEGRPQAEPRNVRPESPPTANPASTTPGTATIGSRPTSADAQASQPPAVIKSSKKKELPDPNSISINDADIDDLERLPGVGPATAQRIIDYRTQTGRFGSLEDLMNVKGIGPKKYEKMAPYLKL